MVVNKQTGRKIAGVFFCLPEGLPKYESICTAPEGEMGREATYNLP